MTHTQVDDVTKTHLQSHENVTAVGEGERNGYPALIISVEPGTTTHRPDLPESVDGLPVVIEEREVREFNGHTGVHRPVVGGVEVANANSGEMGTTGLVMTDGSQRYISSNRHVLADAGSSDHGDPIYQPAWSDGGEDLHVGTVAGHVTKFAEYSALADFAWGTLEDGIEATNRVYGVGLVTDTGSVDVGDEVVRSGRTSGVTEGTVDQVGVVVRSNQSDWKYTGQVLVNGESDAGDSGSPVMLKGTSTAVGVQWGGGDGDFVYSPISNIEQGSGLNVLTHAVEDDKAPVAEFVGERDGLTVTVDASASHDPDGQITEYWWNFGSEASARGVRASHTFSEGGTYPVELLVIDNDGKRDTMTWQAYVEPAEPNEGPTAAIDYVTDGLTVHADGTSSTDPDGSIVAYRWTTGSANYTGQTATINYREAGTYTLSLEVEDNEGATDTATVDIPVSESGSDDDNGDGSDDGESKRSAAPLIVLGLAGAWLARNRR